MLLDGVHLVRDALGAGVPLHDVVVAADFGMQEDIAPLFDALARARVSVVSASATVMAALSPVRSSSPIVALASRPTCDAARMYDLPAPLVVVAVDIQDPGNLGATVRAAEAAGATGFVAAGACADPFSWKALRGSMGSALRLPVRRIDRAAETIDEAHHYRCRVFATVPRGGVSLFDCDFSGGSAIFIGGEGPGLPADVIERADVRVTIPMQAPVESLNAAVTAALMLYEARRQRHETHENTKSTKHKP